MSDSDIPVKEIGELLDEVSTKVPKLIASILDTMFSPEAAKKMGQAIGSLYKELVESGIPQDVALRMARDYMMSLRDIAMSKANEGGWK